MFPVQPNPKVVFALQAKALATEFANMLSQCDLLAETWDDRLFGPGADNAIVDADIADAYVTADDVYSFIILCSQFKTFMNGGTPAVRDYDQTINKIRNI